MNCRAEAPVFHYLLLFLFASFVLFLPSGAFAETAITPASFPNNDIGNAVWTKDLDPYVVSGDVYIRYGSLTIEPGVVVKFDTGATLNVHADVATYIQGTPNEPIYFTSLRDDTISGDTNNDGSLTAPSPGDWGYVSLGEGAWNDDMQLAYTKVRYGGGRGYGGGANTFPEGAGPALVVLFQRFSGSPGQEYSILNVEVSRSQGIGLYAYVGSQNSLTVSNSSFFENNLYGLYRGEVFDAGGNAVAGALDASNNWWGDASGPFHASLNGAGQGNAIGPTPSQWETFSFNPWLSEDPFPDPPVLPTEIDPVIVVPGVLGSAQKDGTWVIDPILHIYDNLIETLDANDYTLGVDLFPFPYDWTRSNVDTALLLKEKIDEVKLLCSCSKVDIVAHSMGGLVARQYIQSASYEGDVDQLIFLGTPHLGAPKAYLMYEAGANDEGVESFLTQLYLSHLAHEEGYEDVFQYIHLKPIPSVRELLPVYDYIFDAGGALQEYPDGYPVNSFLGNLQDTVGVLNGSGVDILNIVGENQLNDTISSFNVEASSILPLWPHGVPSGFLEGNSAAGLNRGQGDGTVPHVSANAIVPSVTINASHAKIPTLGENTVYEELTGHTPEILIEKTLFQSVLVIRAFSPVDLQVIAPDGKRIGKNFLNPNDDFDDVPNAFYSGFNTDTEFIVIPNPLDGEYRLVAEGVDGGGAYTLSASYVTDSAVVTKDFSSTAVVGAQEETPIVFDSSSINPIALPDTAPPVLTIVSPVQETIHLHSTQLPLNVQAEDAGSGISNVLMHWDGEEVTAQTIDLFFESLGQHIFTATAFDNQGNTNTATSAVYVVTTPEDTISDIERAYSLGWILKRSLKSTLVQKVQKAIRLEKRIVFLEEVLPGRPLIVRRIEKLIAKLDRVLAVEIIKELDKALAKGDITQEGYEVIKNDIEWLLENS